MEINIPFIIKHLPLKKIAIIGGHGFIGKNFTDFFLEHGYPVTLVGKNSGSKTFQPEVVSVTAMVHETPKIVDAIKDCEIIIWLASSLIPGVHETSLEKDFETNVKPVIALLENAHQLVLQKFIYLSSGGTIYGDSEEHIPVSEDHSKSPISEYGLSKLVAEQYIQFLTRSSDFESYILRPSNVYGKYQNLNKPQGIIGFAFKSLLNGTAIDLYNDGRVVRDFIFVMDLAEAVLKCIETPIQKSLTHIYNVGNGKPNSIKEMIDKISSISGTEVQTVAKPPRNFDCEYNVLDIEKIRKDLHWQPEVEVDEGLKEVWEWIKAKGND